jgi:TPR repeat protein
LLQRGLSEPSEKQERSLGLARWIDWSDLVCGDLLGRGRQFGMTLSSLRLVALAGMVALLVGAAPLAQTPEPAQDNSINQDGSFNIEAIRTRANAGDVFDQEHLGYIYADGLEGVPQDDIEAVRWFRLAAEQGRVLAQYNLGVAYQLGIGVPQDDVEAIAWYRKAAEQGDADAQFNLPFMYDFGNGVPQDYVEVVKWWRLAAERGLEMAQYNLGVAYQLGIGVPQDDVEAIAWYRLAAEQGYADAQFNLGARYAQGQDVPQDYVEAVKWWRLAAEQGHARAQFGLGMMYDNGEGVLQNHVEAYKWFNLATTYADASSREEFAELRDLTAESLTPEQRADAQRLAREFFEAHPPE